MERSEHGGIDTSLENTVAFIVSTLFLITGVLFLVFPMTFIEIKKRSMFYIPDPLLKEGSKIARFFWRLMGVAMAMMGSYGLYYLLK